MMLDFPKPGGFTSITSSSPQLDAIPLGDVLRGLSDRLATDGSGSIDDTLDQFLEEHERYANATRIASLTSDRALKAWAAERLPSLGLDYGLSNQITPDILQSNLDARSPLKLVEFADNLALVACYCREIADVKIYAAPHPHGLEFQFTFRGQAKNQERSKTEEGCIQTLLNQSARDNFLRKRIFATENKIEAECIVLRNKVRLGFSPLF